MGMSDRMLVGSVTAADCEWTFFRAGGKGGQSQNKTDSGARVRHAPSGAVGESREHKSQLQNRRAAWRRMAESKEFNAWVRREAGVDAAVRAEQERKIEQAVNRQMRPENLLVEQFVNGEWVVVDGEA